MNENTLGKVLFHLNLNVEQNKISKEKNSKKQKNNSTNHFENSIYIIIYTKFRIETILPPNPK